MKCPALPNWGFRKDGSCKREYLCNFRQQFKCGSIRKRKAKAFRKLLTKRNQLKKRISRLKSYILISDTIQGLRNIEADIQRMANS